MSCVDLASIRSRSDGAAARSAQCSVVLLQLRAHMSCEVDLVRCTSETGGRGTDSFDAERPVVSVLMPVFNTVAYLSDAVRSIQRQTFRNFELVIIDDGSKDGSPELLTQLATSEPRISVLLRENRGLISTRNELLRRARSDLVAWMDSDDISSPDRLQLQIAAFAADAHLVCLGGAAQRIDPEGHPLDIERHPTDHDDIVAGQLLGGAMRFPTTMMRRDVALSVGGFREPFKIGEDLDLFLRLSEVGKMANLPSVIYSYRQHASSTFAGLSAMWLSYRHEILALARERKEFGVDRLQRGEAVTIDPTTPFSTATLVADAYAEWAGHALRNGSFDRAWKYARTALRAKPFSPRLWKLSITSGLRAWQNRHL